MTLTSIERGVAFKAPGELVEARIAAVETLIRVGSDPLDDTGWQDVEAYAEAAGDHVKDLTSKDLDPTARIDLLDEKGLYLLGGPIVTKALHAERYSRGLIAEELQAPTGRWLQRQLHTIRARRQVFQETLGIDAVDSPDELTPWIHKINTNSPRIRSVATFSPLVGESVELALIQELAVAQRAGTELIAA